MKSKQMNTDKLKSIRNYLQNLSISSSKLIILTAVYFSFMLNLAFWRFIFLNVQGTSFETVIFLISLIFFIFVPFYLLASLLILPKISKIIISIFLIACSFTNYMTFRLGVFIDKNMMQNVFETNTREAMDLIMAPVLFWVFLTGIVPTIVLMLTTIKYDSLKKEAKQRFSRCLVLLLIIALFVPFTFKTYATFGRNHREIKGIINPLNFISGTLSYAKRVRRAHKTFKILDNDPEIVMYRNDFPRVIVLIIGETARAASFSLSGYERQTNPLLSKQDIVYFRNVSSCGTTTAISLPCMFSIMSRNNFKAEEAKFTQNLVDLAQSAGYEVIWKENDDGCKSVCSRIIKTENMAELNSSKYCKAKYCYDDVLLEGLDELIKGISQNTLIVLHTMGSHGPTYYQRYPEEFEKFTPTCNTADIQDCPLNEIVNTYDNTILYTDYIISSVIDILKKYPQHESGLLYLSDHGESLGENNIYLHAMPYFIAPKEQTEVPMVLWMNNTMKQGDNFDYDCMKSKAQTNSYSHDNLFHTMLGWLHIKTKLYDNKYDILRECRTKPLPYEE